MEIQAALPESKARSQTQKYLLAAVYQEPEFGFYKGVDRDLHWFPAELTPWHYLKSYSDLPVEIRRRYNQLYALGTNEVFAVFEVDFICRILQKMELKKNLSSEVALAITRIKEEEEKHARVFHRLNAAAAPEYYCGENEKKFLILKADGFGVFLLSVISRFPNFFGVWVWIALFFEERSILYSKFYQMSSDKKLDSKFKEVHRLHLIEEVNHVRLDELLVDEFYSSLPRWKKILTRIFLKRVLSSFRSPRRMSYAIGSVLKNEFPGFSQAIDQCLSELPTLRRNSTFQKMLFGSDAYRRTKKLLQKFPELSDLA